MNRNFGATAQKGITIFFLRRLAGFMVKNAKCLSIFQGFRRRRWIFGHRWRIFGQQISVTLCLSRNMEGVLSADDDNDDNQSGCEIDDFATSLVERLTVRGTHQNQKTLCVDCDVISVFSRNSRPIRFRISRFNSDAINLSLCICSISVVWFEQQSMMAGFVLVVDTFYI